MSVDQDSNCTTRTEPDSCCGCIIFWIKRCKEVIQDKKTGKEKGQLYIDLRGYELDMIVLQYSSIAFPVWVPVTL